MGNDTNRHAVFLPVPPRMEDARLLRRLEEQRDHARAWASYYRSEQYGCPETSRGTPPEGLDEMWEDGWIP